MSRMLVSTLGFDCFVLSNFVQVVTVEQQLETQYDLEDLQNHTSNLCWSIILHLSFFLSLSGVFLNPSNLVE